MRIVRDGHLLVFGGTLTPFVGSDSYGGRYGSPQGERQRQALNAWIRRSKAFDGVLDFDKAIRDPADPTRMLSTYDSGDHLHPNDAGYAAMAASISIPLLLRRT
jgi:lysophospholipase L1-like esterase